MSIVTARDAEGLELLRHSTAHLLAYAVKELFPEAQGEPDPANLFIAFDSPQNGANIPLGLQSWLDFFLDGIATISDEVPLRMQMTPMDKPGEYTEFVYEELTFDIELGPGFFSLNQLRR